MVIKSSKELSKLQGKKVTVNITGLVVEGAIVEVYEDQYCYNLVVEHQPVQWGDQTLTKAHQFQRKFDDWGSINNTHLVKSVFENEFYKLTKSNGQYTRIDKVTGHKMLLDDAGLTQMLINLTPQA